MTLWPFSSGYKQGQRYLIPGRLEDVLALIQVLAMGEAIRRGESTLSDELSEQPQSAKQWTELARHHREFFRVIEGADPKVSLIARHLNARHEEGGRLESWLLRGLLDAAIQIHAGQLQRKQVSKAGWIGGLGGAVVPLAYQFLARRYGW